MNDDPTASTGRRILLVDDEALVRAGIAMMIDELGHVVIEASSGKQGLQLLNDDNLIDLLITDFNMPDMDGITVIEKATHMRPALPSLLMTGYATDDARFANVEVSRLEKPFTLDALEAALNGSW